VIEPSLWIFWWLLAGHALADFGLQSEFMARNKNRNLSPSYQPPYTTWPYVLGSHALIHGIMVAIITGDARLGIAETTFHFVIDFGKCEKWYGNHADQAMHILCKVAWTYLAING